MIEKEVGALESFYPIDPSVLKLTLDQVTEDFDGVFKEEFEELSEAQSTIIDVLGEFDLIDLENDPEGTEAVFQGASFAHRLFKNQANLHNEYIPLIPKRIKDTVMLSYKKYQEETKNKKPNYLSRLKFGEKIKAHGSLYETLKELSINGPVNSLTFKRLQGAIITAMIFITYQEVSQLNSQLKLRQKFDRVLP